MMRYRFFRALAAPAREPAGCACSKVALSRRQKKRREQWLPPSSPKTTDELQNSLGVKLSSASQVKVANAPNRKAQRRNQLNENQVDEVVLAPVPNVARTVSATSLSSSTHQRSRHGQPGDRVDPILHHDRASFNRIASAFESG